MEKGLDKGSLRIGLNKKFYSWNGNNWIISGKIDNDIFEIIDLFDSNGKIELLRDEKDRKFLKGILLPNGKIIGARIDVLPDGSKLSGRYSLFSKNLTIHDEPNSDHWDVLYKNPGGGWAYVYRTEKINKKLKKKYDLVQDFSKRYNLLIEGTMAGLKKKDYMALPMLTLLNTRMRFGNQIYFKLHKHKGLSTITKGDVTIKGNIVRFEFLGKDGVPWKVESEFPKEYVSQLKKILSKLKKNEIIFRNKLGKNLTESDFKKAFKRFCGKEFYPHIVRSYYATNLAKDFLINHNNATKKEIRELFLSIADLLGHKKFSKKKGEWVDSYTVTVHHYIEPKIVERIEKLIN